MIQCHIRAISQISSRSQDMSVSYYESAMVSLIYDLSERQGKWLRYVCNDFLYFQANQSCSLINFFRLRLFVFFSYHLFFSFVSTLVFELEHLMSILQTPLPPSSSSPSPEGIWWRASNPTFVAPMFTFTQYMNPEPNSSQICHSYPGFSFNIVFLWAQVTISYLFFQPSNLPFLPYLLGHPR